MPTPFKVYRALKSYGDAFHKVQSLKESKDPDMVYKIVRSGYGDFEVIAISSDLYTAMVIGKVPYLPSLAPGNTLKYADVE